jgi:hypothetical protein
MSIPVTVLIYAGIPLAIIVAFAAAVFLPGEVKSPSRYRPGRPWEHDPSWYLPHQIVSEPSEPVSALHDGHVPLAELDAPKPPPVAAKAVGGASGEW